MVRTNWCSAFLEEVNTLSAAKHIYTLPSAVLPGFLACPVGPELGPHRALTAELCKYGLCESQELCRKWIWHTVDHMKLSSGFRGRRNFAFCFVFKQTQNLKSKHCWTYWVPPGSCQIHVIPQVLYGLGKNPINWIKMTWKAELQWTSGQTGAELQTSMKPETKQILPGFFWGSWILKRLIALPVFIMKLALTGVFIKASLLEMKRPCENLIFHLKESRSFQSLWLWQEPWMCAQAHQQVKTKGDSRDSSMHGIILKSQF